MGDTVTQALRNQWRKEAEEKSEEDLRRAIAQCERTLRVANLEGKANKMLAQLEIYKEILEKRVDRGGGWLADQVRRACVGRVCLISTLAASPRAHLALTHAGPRHQRQAEARHARSQAEAGEFMPLWPFLGLLCQISLDFYLRPRSQTRDPDQLRRRRQPPCFRIRFLASLVNRAGRPAGISCRRQPRAARTSPRPLSRARISPPPFATREPQPRPEREPGEVAAALPWTATWGTFRWLSRGSRNPASRSRQAARTVTTQGISLRWGPHSSTSSRVSGVPRVWHIRPPQRSVSLFT